ncbi:MAG: pitrilysin family protein [Pseudomonadota bacterium]
MNRQILIIFLSSLITPLIAATKVHEYHLDNGLQVIVKPDHRAPLVVAQIWYKVGSSYEETGSTGLSHVLEHMLFKGTKQHGPGEYSRQIAALGGTENAFTGRDYTAYFATLAAEHLEPMLALEADRMQHLVLQPAEFAKELEVVKEERRLRTDDSPTGRTYEQLQAVAWRASPYRNPVIGWMQDLNQMKLADLEVWYQRWYAPNNAVLVVVGDVQPEAVLALAKRYFGPIPRRTVIPLKLQQEPKQHGITRVTVRTPAQQPYLMLGYKVPVIGKTPEDWEPYALAILASLLDGGASARLPGELVRKQRIAASIGANYDPYSRLANLFYFSGTPTDEHTIADLQQALFQQITRLQTDLLTPAELTRVINQAVAAKVYEQDSLFYQAMQIGLLATIGLDWRLSTEEVARLRAVTPEQVRTVAQRYLIENNLTIATLEPTTP